MKILLIHNYYMIAGGEDAVFRQEKLLLEKQHSVIEFVVSNHSIDSFFDKILTSLQVCFSFKSYFALKYILEKEKPDVVHVHNFFPLLSPAVFYACKKFNIPVVHTLHNFRSVCPTALLMHKGQINERSINKSAWWAVKEKVYRGSFIGSFSIALMVQVHKRIGTWKKRVDRFIALTHFAKDKYISAGWPECKVVIKPNFIEDPFSGSSELNKRGGYALFVGRLSEEKGIGILFNAWENIDYPLKVVGVGPLENYVQNNTNKNIEYLGLKNKEQVIELIVNADFLVMASTWYEGFPMVLVEALASGTPAIVPDIGSMKEIIQVGCTGLHFRACDSMDLALQVKKLLGDTNKMKAMGILAREEYLNKYTPEKNYEMLMDIYSQAINEAKNNAA